MGENRDILNEHSGAMASLAEMTYRRNDGVKADGTADGDATIITHIDTVEGYSAYNPLNNQAMIAAAEAARLADPNKRWDPNGYNAGDYIEDEYGLTVDPVDRGDGLTHFYTDNGFSAYVSIRDDDPSTDIDESAVVITIRGTDLADNEDGVMMDYIVDTGTAIAASDTKDEFVESIEDPGIVRGGFKWIKDLFRGDENEIGEQDYSTYSRRDVPNVPIVDEEGRIIKEGTDIGYSQHVDPGDWYSNVKLGSGTYSETQYDDARALYEFVQEHVADGRPIVSNGQSLGGGLAGLIGAENGLETHTFGMAPFDNQLDIIGQRNALSEMTRGPVETRGNSVDVSQDFGSISEHMEGLSTQDRLAFERELAQDFSRLRTDVGSHPGRIANQRINGFNDKYEDYGVDVDRDTIRAVRAESAENAEGYRAFAQTDDFTASTVAYEFTTNARDGSESSHIVGGSGLGLVIDSSSADIVQDENMHIVRLGRDMSDFNEAAGAGGTFMRESIVRHSPAFNELLINSQDRGVLDKTDFASRDDYAGGQFSEVFRDNERFKFGAFHESGLLGGVTRGKEGADDDLSASRSEMPTNETVYRALSISERGDQDLYNYTTDFFLQPAHGQGRITEGADADNPNDLSLSNGVTQIGMQILRDDVSGLSYNTLPSGAGAQFAGDYRATGYAELDLTKIDSEHWSNYARDEEGRPLDGMDAIHGVDSIRAAIVDEVAENMDPTVLYTMRGAFVTETAEQKAYGITGGQRTAELGIEGSIIAPHVRPTINRGLDVNRGELEFGSVVVQTGETQDINLDLNSLSQANPDNTRVSAEGAAVFMGDGSDNITDGTGRDYVLMGEGDNTFTDRGTDSDLIVGGQNFDTYQASLSGGPVMVTVDGNHSIVTAVSAETEANNGGLIQDQLVAIEQIRGGDSADVFNIENVSGNMYVDGVSGDDKVYIGDLSRGYVLDLENGQDPQGQAYSARVINGDDVLYIRNVDDANILRESAPSEDSLREDSTAQMEAEKRLDPPTIEKIDIPVAAGVLNQHLPAFHAELTGLKESGQMSREDRDMLDVIETSMPGALFKTLHENGVASLDITDKPMSTPRETVESLMTSAADAYDPETMPKPEIERVAQQNQQAELEQADNNRRDESEPYYDREDDTVSAAI